MLGLAPPPKEPASPWIFERERGPKLDRGWCLRCSALLCSALASAFYLGPLPWLASPCDINTTTLCCHQPAAH